MNPIELAVLPIKQQSIDWAVAAADKEVNQLLSELADAGNDARKYAPYPSSGNRDYFLALHKYEMISRITKAADENNYDNCMPNKPLIVVANQKGIDGYKDAVARDAAAQYDAYVAKLNMKIGEVTAATLQNLGGVWYNSILTVTKTDGTQERWSTQCILNRSKHNKLFNQFPTRKMK